MYACVHCSAHIVDTTFQFVTVWCLLQNTRAEETGEQVEQYAASNVNPQTRYTGSSSCHGSSAS